MAETAEYTEKQINYGKRFANADFQTKSIVDAISHATCAMAIDVDAKCIVVSSLTGRTVRMVSRFRCPVDIIGMTTSEKAWRKLNLSWGVKPVLCEEYNSMEVMFYNAMNEGTQFAIKKIIAAGDTFIPHSSLLIQPHPSLNCLTSRKICSIMY